MPATEVAQAHYAQRQALVAATAAVAARQWAQVHETAIAVSWTRQLPALAVTVSGAQLAAAQAADPYVQAALLAEGVAPLAELAVTAGAFAGVAADGRDLLSLLYQPAITALIGIQGGRDVAESLAAGALQLDTMVRTEVADAGRVADGVAVTAHNVDGYVRLVVGNTCNRCIILAGRVYPWSQGFERHPRCDCVMVPAANAEAAGIAQSPRSMYDSMTPEQRSAAGWSKAEQQAIADGADIAAVTNIHREGSLYTAGGRRYTREAAGKRPRITPEQIYRDANGDREEALRLLRLHRYIR